LNNVFCSREKHDKSRDATHSESTSLWQPTQSQLFETLGTHMLNLDASSSYLLEVHLDFIISEQEHTEEG
jgi:hypothetical protein